MKKKETKKVYKTNKKLLKKVLVTTLIIFIIILLSFPLKYGIQMLYYNTWKTYDVSNYEFSFKIPRAFQSLQSENDAAHDLGVAGFTSEYDVKVDEKYVGKKPKVIYSGANVINGISMMVQCIATEKTTKTLDEIAEGNQLLIKIYYEEEYQVGELQKEFLNILGADAVKSIVDIQNEEETKTFVTYLVPLEDKEITITFLGDKDQILNYMSNMDEIVKNFQ